MASSSPKAPPTQNPPPPAAATTAHHHCVRCPANFTVPSGCRIHHDEESFQGSRNGGSWYKGILGCCGAKHKFHRHYDESCSNPKYCFDGNHTTNPQDVNYSLSTISPCDKNKCGRENHLKVKAERKEQRARKKARNLLQKEEKKQRMQELLASGQRREARNLRADMLGYEYETDELNSEQDPDSCIEFDCASDSSLVPPW